MKKLASGEASSDESSQNKEVIMPENFESPREQDTVSANSQGRKKSSDISASNTANARSRISQRELSSGHRSLIDHQEPRLNSTKAFVGLRLRHNNQIIKE